MTNLAPFSYLIAPLIAMVIIVYLKSRFKIKTSRYLYMALLLGILSPVLVYLAQVVMDATGINYLKNLKRTAFYAIVAIAFSSELAKFLFLRYYFFVRKSFFGPVDGIIYNVFIGLGFATSATLLLGFGLISANVGDLYLFTFGAANIIFGVISGFFVGLGKTRSNRFIDSMTGLFAATIFHGLYTFSFLTRDPRLLLLFAIGSIVIVILLIIKALSIKIYDDPKRH